MSSNSRGRGTYIGGESNLKRPKKHKRTQQFVEATKNHLPVDRNRGGGGGFITATTAMPARLPWGGGDQKAPL